MKTNLVKKYCRTTFESQLNLFKSENSFLVVEYILTTSSTSEELVKGRVDLSGHVQTFIRSAESGSSAVGNRQSVRGALFLYYSCNTRV